MKTRFLWKLWKLYLKPLVRWLKKRWDNFTRTPPTHPLDFHLVRSVSVAPSTLDSMPSAIAGGRRFRLAVAACRRFPSPHHCHRSRPPLSKGTVDRSSSCWMCCERTHTHGHGRRRGLWLSALRASLFRRTEIGLDTGWSDGRKEADVLDSDSLGAECRDRWGGAFWPRGDRKSRAEKCPALWTGQVRAMGSVIDQTAERGGCGWTFGRRPRSHRRWHQSPWSGREKDKADDEVGAATL